MLRIENINKKYVTGSLVQTALDGITLNFRDNEFVAVLGPSGSGKTTMLNIIGGLDRYDSGDLIINGISTKKYRDRDWDSYRNHTIGFVFQSYNLIPHQTILSNVELALTISGVSRSERKRRAMEALDKVGLKDQMHKRPNQMSGGQMQRVAIARALVNDPDILLADEPTGALDSETSVNVMDLLAEVAKDRLVIMVTHNPDLAEKYANRIVRLSDGKITDDSNPYEPEKEEDEPVHKNMGRSTMSFGTALLLSFNNLRTKKGRTILTSFAGSIGIIGIALILSLSNGVSTYIDSIQRSTMASYPITLEGKTIDLSSVMEIRQNQMGKKTEEELGHSFDAVYSDNADLQMVSDITTSFTENNLTKFKKYLENKESDIHKYIGSNGIVYSYSTKFSLLCRDEKDFLVNTDGSTLVNDNQVNMFTVGLSGNMGMMSEYMNPTLFSQLIPDSSGKSVSTAIKDNYEVVYGHYPENSSEMVLVLDENNEIPITQLYQLGFLPTEDYRNLTERITNSEKVTIDLHKLTYKDICEKEFYLIPECDLYEQQSNGTYKDISSDSKALEKKLDNAFKLRISGVLKPVEGNDIKLIKTPLAYSGELTDYIISYTNDSDLVKEQMKEKTRNVLNGMMFNPKDDNDKAEDAKTYLSKLGVSDKALIYQTIILPAQAQKVAEDAAESAKKVNVSEAVTDLNNKIPPVGPEQQSDVTAAMTDPQGEMSEEALAKSLDEFLKAPDEKLLLSVYSNYIRPGSYDDTLEMLGVVSYDAPSAINLYADSFEAKDGITACIADYNKDADEADKITYTDYVGLLMSSVTTIINVITYVLVAFVAVSLVVSSIMIGIITYISVLERTKEIGILRAIGASKKNISQVFNAETFIIGLLSGVIGIGITLVMLVPINAVIHAISGIDNVNAILPLGAGGILILLSTILTLIGGFIPSKKAARRDPVAALRSE